jgi:hypothetical protein
MTLLESGPRSGRRIWQALKGAQRRASLKSALEHGEDLGQILRVPRRAKGGGALYRLAALPDIHSVTPPEHFGSSVPERFPPISANGPAIPEQIEVSRPSVTRCAVTPGERTSLTLQETSIQKVRTSKIRTTVRTRVTESRTPSRPGDEVLGSLQPDGRELVVADEQRRAIAAGNCCGRDGAELRSQLCQWSSRYLPLLRADRERRERELASASSCS